MIVYIAEELVSWLNNYGRFGAVLVFAVVLCRNELNVVCIYHRALYFGSEIRVYRVHDVTVASVGIFARGHNYEISFSSVDNLDVVNGEAIVKGDGYDSLHRPLVKEFSDFDVCNLHNLVSFPTQ